MSEESVSLCFLVTFNIIINYIFTKKFIEIHLSEDIFLTKKTNYIGIYKTISAVF